jgi:protein O-GlcNAc transferase
MRGRHSSAILTMMGLTKTIASSVDKHIEIAVRLGKDSGWRRHIAEKIQMSKHKIYYDRESIKALEEFFVKAVEVQSSA